MNASSEIRTATNGGKSVGRRRAVCVSEGQTRAGRGAGVSRQTRSARACVGAHVRARWCACARGTGVVGGRRTSLITKPATRRENRAGDTSLRDSACCRRPHRTIVCSDAGKVRAARVAPKELIFPTHRRFWRAFERGAGWRDSRGKGPRPRSGRPARLQCRSSRGRVRTCRQSLSGAGLRRSCHLRASAVAVVAEDAQSYCEFWRRCFRAEVRAAAAGRARRLHLSFSDMAFFRRPGAMAERTRAAYCCMRRRVLCARSFLTAGSFLGTRGLGCGGVGAVAGAGGVTLTFARSTSSPLTHFSFLFQKAPQETRSTVRHRGSAIIIKQKVYF